MAETHLRKLFRLVSSWGTKDLNELEAMVDALPNHPDTYMTTNDVYCQNCCLGDGCSLLLMIAANFGNLTKQHAPPTRPIGLRIVKKLLDKGADPMKQRVRTERGSGMFGYHMTPIWRANDKGQMDLVDMFLERGAQFRVEDTNLAMWWVIVDPSPHALRVYMKHGFDGRENIPNKKYRKRTPLDAFYDIHKGTLDVIKLQQDRGNKIIPKWKTLLETEKVLLSGKAGALRFYAEEERKKKEAEQKRLDEIAARQRALDEAKRKKEEEERRKAEEERQRKIGEEARKRAEEEMRKRREEEEKAQIIYLNSDEYKRKMAQEKKEREAREEALRIKREKEEAERKVREEELMKEIAEREAKTGAMYAALGIQMFETLCRLSDNVDDDDAKKKVIGIIRGLFTESREKLPQQVIDELVTKLPEIKPFI